MFKKSNDTNQTQGNQANTQKSPHSESRLEFLLVMFMLLSLTVLVVLIVILPTKIDSKELKDFIDYSKWVLTALLAAFGAWIGAGAAYFFGKENLRLNNQSTQQALEIQRDTAKNRPELELVKNINLTPISPNFKFSLDTNVMEVLAKLGENVDYWFVPVVEKEKLKDTIHTEAFWRYFKEEYDGYKQSKNEEPKIKEVIDYIEANKNLEQKRKKLHGFFLEVKMDDLLQEVSKKMDIGEKSVGIVCDQENKPTHCFSKKDLRSFLLGRI